MATFLTRAEPDARPLVGVALVALAVLFFALGDVLTKGLTARYPIPMIVAVRYLASLILLTVFVWPRLRSRLWKTERTGLVLLRGCTLALASLTMGLALRLMPIGETIAIMYVSPFAVMAIAVPLLGEKVTPVGWFFAILGFCGVLLIMRPGGGLDPMGVLWALLNAACATAYHLLTRVLSRTETSIAMIFHVTLVGAVFFTLSALPTLSGPLPSLPDFGAMVLLGMFATSGHFLFAVAYRHAPASLIAPVNYLHLVWAALLGWLVFGDLPDGISMIGIAMIILAGVCLAVKSHLQRH
ncbi:DMT family transporter [Yoonia maritima]|uniref:DMT family transporter n=1 Tax=Yoonia maritima TaxID=1435347 RepID=UPI000D0E44FC|nr:DMT family transporter [Yoonia maritima]